ncbi:MAG: hypothetical protein MRJ93_03845 [Nitrososphaeraceae archaeon]|nr:hypothetical protein [Nitrososphaeraceae archaeon]
MQVHKNPLFDRFLKFISSTFLFLKMNFLLNMKFITDAIIIAKNIVQVYSIPKDPRLETKNNCSTIPIELNTKYFRYCLIIVWKAISLSLKVQNLFNKKFVERETRIPEKLDWMWVKPKNVKRE